MSSGSRLPSIARRCVPVEMDENQDVAALYNPLLPNQSLDAESLEAPGPLRSIPPMDLAGPGPCFRQFPVLPDPVLPDPVSHHAHLCPVPQNRNYEGLVSPGQNVSHDVIREVHCDLYSSPADPGQRRTITLPEECKTVFITYSVDADIVPFAKFLLANGFMPAIDIFDGPIRSMDTTKWMDRYLNDKSLLILVIITPQYKQDVEGLGPDEHRLHTKYIHKQIQNEFIQQGCLNFRLVPVLFPGVTLGHVPNWLQSTKLYRWPQDASDLLLRLFRMERYIVPTPGPGLTLSVRPL